MRLRSGVQQKVAGYVYTAARLPYLIASAPARSDCKRAGAAGLTPRSWGMILAIVLTCAYWLIWFGVDRNILASSHASSYYTFENAFPLADGWLVLTLTAWSRRPGSAAPPLDFWLPCSPVAPASTLDAWTYSSIFENHIYTVPQGGDASGPVIEITINVLTFTLAILIITWVWRHRSWFLTGSPSGVSVG